MIPGFGRTGFGRDEIYPGVQYICLHDWVNSFGRANVGIHMPAPWFAYGIGNSPSRVGLHRVLSRLLQGEAW